MFKRLAAGISSPRKVATFINDKWYMPILYLLIIGLIYLIPVVYFATTEDILSYEMQKSIKSGFYSSEVVNYKVEDNRFVYLENGTNKTVVDTEFFRLIFTNDKVSFNDLNNSLNLILRDDVIKIVYSGLTLKEISLNQCADLENLDFRQAKDNDDEFYTKLYSAIDNVLESYKTPIIVGSIIYNVLYMNFEILLIALMMAFVVKMQTKVSFSNVYKLTLYITLPAFMGMFLAVLYNMYFISVIGMIISFVFSYRLSSELRLKGGF